MITDAVTQPRVGFFWIVFILDPDVQLTRRGLLASVGCLPQGGFLFFQPLVLSVATDATSKHLETFCNRGLSAKFFNNQSVVICWLRQRSVSNSLVTTAISRLYDRIDGQLSELRKII